MAQIAFTVYCENDARKLLQRKLNPARFPGMSNRMTAMVAMFLDVTEQGDTPWFTRPAPPSCMTITSDGFLIADDGEFHGPESELRQNWKRLLDSVDEFEGFDGNLREWADLFYDAHVLRVGDPRLIPVANRRAR